MEEYLSSLRARFPGRVVSVTLFGSKARGDADGESDIDLLVLVNEEDPQLRSDLWRIASCVSLKHNVVLSVRVFSEERWVGTRRLRPPLYRAVQADGILLTPP